MQRLTILFLIVLTGFSQSFAQNQYEVIPDHEEGKLFKGIISRELLTSDTAMNKWYTQNLQGYAPNAEGLEALKANRDSIQILVFMGTWCHDSHFIIPKLYFLLDAAGVSPSRQTLIGVDREKKTLSHLAEALGVTNVPTIMVMKNGKELGRVVEYGKYGMFDKEIGDILQSAE